MNVHSEIEQALKAANRPVTGPIETAKSWGRSTIYTAPTRSGSIWIKYAYRLPPGEEKVLAILCRRWPDRTPKVVATWPGAVAMEPLRGAELQEDAPARDWVAAAVTLAEIAAGEADHIDEWLALGVRDRRPDQWPAQLEELRTSPVMDDLEPDIRHRFEARIPEFITRYTDAFDPAVATLVHQDSGCCNIHLTPTGPVIFDWADVVVGHAAFSLDRLLDQVPREHHPEVIAAFAGPLATSPGELHAMRRSNVLHEVLRYHDELAYLDPEDPAHLALAKSVRSQITVLTNHYPEHG